MPVARRILLPLVLIIASMSARSEELRLEWLTSDEVGQAVANGTFRAIIFAGSTEQNDEHMILGKHNRVAETLAIRLAQQLGNALVYPILPFAPTGDPHSRSGHMAHPGSINLTANSYRMVLHDLIESAITSGFREILLMGDHGDGQEVMQAVAEKFDSTLKTNGIRVLHVSAIYTSATGSHAGPEDTHMLAAASENSSTIRTNKLPFPSDPAMGNRLLKIRIDAALAQIRAFEAAR